MSTFQINQIQWEYEKENLHKVQSLERNKQMIMKMESHLPTQLVLFGILIKRENRFYMETMIVHDFGLIVRTG